MLKGFMEYTVKSKFYLPTNRTPEKSIEDIVKSIRELGGNSNIIGNKLVKEIPEK